jgi:hypothetical protein
VQKGATVDHCNKSILQRYASHVQEGCEVSEAHQLFGPSRRSSKLPCPMGGLLPHSNSPHGGNYSHDGQLYFISVWKSNIESPGRGVQWKGTEISLYEEWFSVPCERTSDLTGQKKTASNEGKWQEVGVKKTTPRGVVVRAGMDSYDFMHALCWCRCLCNSYLWVWPPVREKNSNMTIRFSSWLRLIILEFGLVNLLMKQTKYCITVTVVCWNPP